MATLYVVLNIFIVLFIFIWVLFRALESDTLHGAAAWMAFAAATGYGMIEGSIFIADFIGVL